mmetsp:Transcript_128877/g.223517  ORF Transcript_128877/g.223517 Transcript_128877/m.223517 type:complete len:109 (-) Transcript_128877:1082-1408(-)
MDPQRGIRNRPQGLVMIPCGIGTGDCPRGRVVSCPCPQGPWLTIFETTIDGLRCITLPLPNVPRSGATLWDMLRTVCGPGAPTGTVRAPTMVRESTRDCVCSAGPPIN